jgi:predicted TIM-barrel fold metal-dependent hydrolase
VARLLAFPVVDAHLHWWDREACSYPWLSRGSPEPALGDHRALMRNFGFAEYSREIGRWLDVAAGVHVEAGCADALGEARWVAGEAERHRFPLAHVARVDLTRDDAEMEIERLAGLELTRGLRMRLNADPRIAGRSGIADEPVFRRHFGALAGKGLLFELSIYPPQAEEGVRLARDFPDTHIVLNHLGWPRFGEGLDSFESWRAAMRRLASCPNLTVKLSMLWPIERAWQVEVIRPFVLETMALFGPARVMFGSNFPIETVMGSTEHQLAALLTILRDLSRVELEGVFRTNAERVFSLSTDRLTGAEA